MLKCDSCFGMNLSHNLEMIADTQSAQKDGHISIHYAKEIPKAILVLLQCGLMYPWIWLIRQFKLESEVQAMSLSELIEKSTITKLTMKL